MRDINFNNTRVTGIGGEAVIAGEFIRIAWFRADKICYQF